jgi:hypothetical protein
MNQVKLPRLELCEKGPPAKREKKKIQAGTEAENLGPTLRKELFSEMRVLVTLPVLGRHTVSLLNFKNKTSFPPLNYVPTLNRDKKGYTAGGRKAKWN